MASDLLQIVECQRGHFRHESGLHGDLWIDLDRLLIQPRRIELHIAKLAGMLAEYRVDAVCGPMTGGALVAQSVAAELGARFAFAERVAPGDAAGKPAYRVPTSLRGEVGGLRIAVVDDAINAGYAVAQTVADLAACGADCVAAGALILLEPGRGRPGLDDIPLMGVATIACGLWLPADCPLCGEGRPLDLPAVRLDVQRPGG